MSTHQFTAVEKGAACIWNLCKLFHNKLIEPSHDKAPTSLTLLLALFFALISPSAITYAQETTRATAITLLWTERRPFQYTDDDGRPRGVIVELGKSVFSFAGLPVSWVEAPANRVISEIKANEKPLCAVGWYKTSDRESLAQFSLPIYQDKPLRAVFLASARIEQGIPSTVVFRDMKFRLLLKQGFSYGSFIDELISQKESATIQRVAGEVPNFLGLLRAGRADFILLSQEEIDYYRKLDANFSGDFKVISFNEAPRLEQRYIMCSKRIDGQTMARINFAISSVIKYK